MKKLIFALAAFCVFSSLQAQETFKRYPFKSGIIEYKVEGKSQGTQTTWFDDYGWKEATLATTTTKMLGMTSTDKKLTIINGTKMYSIDLIAKEGTEMDHPFLEIVQEDPDLTYEEACDKIMAGIGYQKEGTATVLDKTCTVYSGIGKAYVWKSLPLRNTANILGMKVDITATSIKTDVDVDAEHFEVPSGIKMVKMEDAIEEANREANEEMNEEANEEANNDTNSDNDEEETVDTNKNKEVVNPVKEIKGLLKGMLKD